MVAKIVEEIVGVGGMVAGKVAIKETSQMWRIWEVISVRRVNNRLQSKTKQYSATFLPSFLAAIPATIPATFQKPQLFLQLFRS